MQKFTCSCGLPTACRERKITHMRTTFCVVPSDLFFPLGSNSQQYLSTPLTPLHLLRMGSSQAKMPKKPLELWGYEASPFTKVRIFCSLLDASLQNSKHQVDRSRVVQVPVGRWC